MPAKRVLVNPEVTPTVRARHQMLRIKPPQQRHHHSDTELMVVNIGYPTDGSYRPRQPRLAYHDVVSVA
jgi:hypothetical protein